MGDNIKPHSSYRWVILAITCLATFIGCYAQFQIPSLAYKLIPDLNLTPSQYASILSAPMLPSIFFSIAVGALADRFGVKRVVTVGFLFAIVGITFRFTAKNYWQMLILMAMAGCSSAFLNANISKLLGAWFPPEKIGSAMGVVLASATGAMAIGTATSAMFPSMKSAFITAGVICAVIAALWVLFMKDKPEGAPDLPAMPVINYLGVAVRSRSIWLVGFAMMFIMGAMMAFSGFLPNALYAVRGIDPVKAGFIASLGTIGGFAGSILGPVICDRLGYMKPFLITAALLSAAGMFYAWQTPLGAIMWVLFIINGFMNASISPMLMSFPMLLPEIGPVYAGSAGGLIATMQLIGAFCIPTFVIAPLAGTNFKLMFGLAAMCYLLAAVVFLFLPELGIKARCKTAAGSSRTA
ncbi:MFS transporter [Thermosediminibacter oceani]|uniref:Major facilitator superfamily MFS_1 n=1 Tax=Thermosediminibacter oceani (strain ATCC BAA-1034 / DSM 16646 / JW/IW-1228P) TaxID=555079 RepID=D9S2C8_THEOJ|nr:MFS transporter [Thermosediminibacter oceani]ADL07555.1 major facilitator superfamily MFS_1 [Thermosediminibacter oceani DSM 16646]